MGRVSRAGRETRRVRLAGVAKSQEHHATVSRHRGGRVARRREDRCPRRRDRRARRRRPSVVPGLHHSSFADVSVVYYAFDLLYLNAATSPVRRSTTAARRSGASSATRACAVGAAAGDARADCVGRAAAWVSKGSWRNEAAPPTRPAGGSDAWIKVRFAKHQEFVIGGFKPNATNFDSLLVGCYEGSKLVCAGRVRSGFTPQSRVEVFREIGALEVKRCPFANLPSSTRTHWGEGITAEEMERLRWVTRDASRRSPSRSGRVTAACVTRRSWACARTNARGT